MRNDPDPLRGLVQPDLDAELTAAENRLWRKLGGVRRFGITDQAAFNSGRLGLTRATCDQQSYRPYENGVWLLVLGLWWPFEPRPDCPFEGETHLVDLLAFDPRQPDLWFYRLGPFDHVIGGWQVCEGTSVIAHPTPFAWLKADCRGIVDLGALARLKIAA